MTIEEKEPSTVPTEGPSEQAPDQPKKGKGKEFRNPSRGLKSTIDYKPRHGANGKLETVWDVDWDKYRLQWWAGRTARDIAAEIGCSQQTVYKKANRGGWIRGGQKQANVMAMREANARLTGPVETEQQALEQQGAISAQVLMAHRQDIARQRDTCATLIEDFRRSVNAAQSYRGHLKALYEDLILNAPNSGRKATLEREKQNALRAVSLPEQSKTMLTLAQASKVLQEMERKAYALDDESEEYSYEDSLRELLRRASDGDLED